MLTPEELKKGWLVTAHNDSLISITPPEDTGKHQATSMNCKCKPWEEHVNGIRIVIHRAFDNREVYASIEEIMRGGKK